eukprot:GHRR01000855.1.p2 GENE.GHRR01000855.1~~GHRR01000855.1.p2  ORF type:complete len:365 (+),score=-51.00 GHRR01000855.1:222-1316(+)
MKIKNSFLTFIYPITKSHRLFVGVESIGGLYYPSSLTPFSNSILSTPFGTRHKPVHLLSKQTLGRTSDNTNSFLFISQATLDRAVSFSVLKTSSYGAQSRPVGVKLKTNPIFSSLWRSHRLCRSKLDRAGRSQKLVAPFGVTTDSKTKNSTKKTLKYSVQKYQRSNQDTLIVQRPTVREGDWVQSGDLLADCSSSLGGELCLGKNILIAYMPWEGYNYEDAILISERLVSEDIYTSIHIESYEVETRTTKFGKEQITKQIPDVSENEKNHLDNQGIAKLGTFVKEGQILVGKVTPIQKKFKSAYEKLLYTILEKELIPMRDSSLRTPKGLQAKVIETKISVFSNVHQKTQIYAAQTKAAQKKTF